MTNQQQRPFKVGEPVRHSIFGTGEVKEVLNDMCRVKFNMGLKWIDAQYLTPALIITHADPEAVYKYGDQVEATNHDEWPEEPHDGLYGFPDPDGKRHWIIMSEHKMAAFTNIRPIPVDAREVLSTELHRLLRVEDETDNVQSEMMKVVDHYLATMKAKWEAEQKIFPNMDDWYDWGKDISTFLAFMPTPEGQMWLKKRREGEARDEQIKH